MGHRCTCSSFSVCVGGPIGCRDGRTDGMASGDKERAIFIPSHSNFRPSQGAQPLAASSCIRDGPTLRYALSAIGGEVHCGISPNADNRAGSLNFSDTAGGEEVQGSICEVLSHMEANVRSRG